MPHRADWIWTLSSSAFLQKIETCPPDEHHQLLFLRLARDPMLFAQLLLPHHCRLPFAPFHQLLFEWHNSVATAPLARRRGRRFALAAPRGSAKSTIASLILVLHDIIFVRERYIVLLSATEKQAQQRLRAIRSELRNKTLTRFAAVTSESAFTQRTIVFAGARVEAYGAGTEIRGLNHEGHRPTKIILDDAEASHVASSQRSREKLHQWYSEIVEYLGDTYTNIIAIGTVLHQKGLLAALLERADFTGHRARSIERFSSEESLWADWRRRLLDFRDPNRRAAARDFFLQHREQMEAGTQVLWPEKEDYEELMTQLVLQGRRAFYQEKQNEPLQPEEALFDVENAMRARVVDGTLEIGTTAGGSFVAVRCYTDYRSTARRFGYLDAALGKSAKKGRGDFAALAAVLLLQDGTIVLERLLARRISPSEQVQKLFDLHDHAPFERLAIEGTGFQELLLLPIEEERERRRTSRRRADLPTQVAHPRKGKAARIAALEPLFSNGTLALFEDLDEEFWVEIAGWPKSTHDDALDALAGAVELARLQISEHEFVSAGKRTTRHAGRY